jgi:hypothetical protein
MTAYNDMFNYIDGVLRALAKKKTQLTEDLVFTVKLAPQKLSNQYAEVTPTTGILLISAQIFDPFQKLQSVRNWDKEMDIIPVNVTSYTTQYQLAIWNYAENEYSAKHRCVPVIILPSLPCFNPVLSGTSSGRY